MYDLYSIIQVWKLHEIKITRIQKRWLTFDFHAHCAINRNTFSIVSCATVCSICTSLDTTQDIFSTHKWKQRCTVCNTIFHSRPSNSWRWFTSCITTQNNERAFTNHLIMTHTSDFRGNWKIIFKKGYNLEHNNCHMSAAVMMGYNLYIFFSSIVLLSSSNLSWCYTLQ